MSVTSSPTPPSTPSNWKAPGWDAQVQAWIISALASRGLALSGPLEELRARPWSAILRVPTPMGDAYFKATVPELAHEAGLTHYLATQHPEMLPHLLAHDSTRGWMLMAGGTRLLRDVLRAPGASPAGEGIQAWETILPEYARLQIELAGRTDDLQALGVPDRRLQSLPTQIGSLLHETETLAFGLPDGVTHEEYERLLYALPQVESLCARLASFKVPPSLDHGDLHDGNIFVQNGSYLYFDWGDASLTHPFFSMRAVLVGLENTFDLEQDNPFADRLRDIYLESWRSFEPPERLLEAYALSQRLAPLSAALRWYVSLRSYGDFAGSGFHHAIPWLLREFMDLNQEKD